MQIFQQTKRNLDIKFWFGGRVQRSRFVIAAGEIEAAEKENEI